MDEPKKELQLPPISELEVPDHLKSIVKDDPFAGRTQMPKVLAKNYKSISKAMKKFGAIKIQPSELEAFHQIGLSVDSASMVQLARAGAFVSQQALLALMKDLMRISGAASDRAKVKLVPHIGFLAGKLTGIGKLMYDDGKKDAIALNAAQTKPAHQFVPLSKIEITVNTQPSPEKQAHALDIKSDPPKSD